MQNLCTNVPSIYCCGNSLNVSEEVPPPMADGDTGLEKLVLTRLLRLNATLQGVVTGMVVGLGVFIATNWLLLKGGEVVGPHLSLLGQFFIGYRVKSFGKLYRICVWLRTRFCRRILRRQNIQLDCSRQRRKTLRPSTTQTALKIIESPTRAKLRALFQQQ